MACFVGAQCIFGCDLKNIAELQQLFEKISGYGTLLPIVCYIFLHKSTTQFLQYFDI